MNITIIGKNSSVFLIVRKRLLQQVEFLELESQEAINDVREKKLVPGRCLIIFSGVVTEDENKLKEIEGFHSIISNEISNTETRVILISSSAVYGTYKSVFSESDDCLPTSNYGLSKVKIEQMYLKHLNQNVAILRLGNVLGFDTVAKVFSATKECDRYINCRQDLSTPKRTYVDGQILSDLISRYIENFEDLPQILNVGREKPQAMHNAAIELGMNFRYKITKSVLKDLTLDTSHLFKILNGTENNK